MEEIKEGIYEVLELMGICTVGGDEDEDLREYIIDSLQFINFILEVEHHFEIEVPVNILVYDNIASLNGFAGLIEELVDEKCLVSCK
ncbi:MAG: acyl carrier protein [Acetatifactor sp.]